MLRRDRLDSLLPGLFALCGMVSCAPPAQRAPRVPLTSVGLVSSEVAPPDPNDPRGGGSMDAAAYFVTSLMPDIKKCTDKVLRVAQTWTREQGLTVTDDPRPGDAILHATGADLGGMLELTYVVEPTGLYTRARTTLWFYTFEAARREPNAIRALLEHRHVAQLEDELRRAVRCEDN